MEQKSKDNHESKTKTQNTAKRSLKKSKSISAQPKRTKKEAEDKVRAFPLITLEEAIKIPQAIYEKFGSRALPAELIAMELGYAKIQDFKDALKAANQYGIVSGRDAWGIVRLTELGKDMVVIHK